MAMTKSEIQERQRKLRDLENETRQTLDALSLKEVDIRRRMDNLHEILGQIKDLLQLLDREALKAEAA
jgi:hypothetical protein